MSATKPPPGYDDRFVVPLEPSRRGAHRARVSPVIGVLPMVAVVAVVVVVVLLTWTLFHGSSGASDAGSTAGGVPSVTQSLPTTQPSAGETVPTPTGSHSASASASSSASGGAVDKTVTITVLNSTTRTGLAGKVATTLTDKGWTGAKFSKTKATARPTTVYYATTSEKAAAEAVVADLGIGVVKKSTLYGTAGLTVIVGTDYP